jgi:hypothetical protein
MFVVMCEWQELLILWQVLGLLKIMDFFAMIVLDIIGIPFGFFRHELQKIKDL